MIFHKSEVIEQHYPKCWEDVQTVADEISRKGKGWQREDEYKGEYKGQDHNKGGYKAKDSGGYKGKNQYKGGYKGQDKRAYKGKGKDHNPQYPPLPKPTKPLRSISTGKPSRQWPPILL